MKNSDKETIGRIPLLVYLHLQVFVCVQAFSFKEINVYLNGPCFFQMHFINVNNSISSSNNKMYITGGVKFHFQTTESKH